MRCLPLVALRQLVRARSGVLPGWRTAVDKAVQSFHGGMNGIGLSVQRGFQSGHHADTFVTRALMRSLDFEDEQMPFLLGKKIVFNFKSFSFFSHFFFITNKPAY